MNVLSAGRCRGKTPTEDYDEASKNFRSWRAPLKIRAPTPGHAPTPGPVKDVFDDDDGGRTTPRIVDLMETTEALQARKMKQYEEERSKKNSNHGHRVLIPRCPLTGAGRKVRRRLRTLDGVSPRLFTISNFLTPSECDRYVTSAEASQKFRHQTKDYHLGWGGGDAFAKNEYTPWFCSPEKLWKAQKAQAEHFTRTNAYNQDMVVVWSSKLKAAFEGISLEGHDKMRAVSVDSWSMIHRYEKGEKCEPHNTGQRPRNYAYRGGPELPTIDGCCVLVYLNGGQAGDDSSDGSPGVVGGETVFYSQQYLNGNSMKKHIAKVAPETGLAVCIAAGHRSPLTEIRPVTKGVVYMLEFRVQFELS